MEMYFFYYLSEINILKYDFIDDGWVIGTLLKDLHDIPKYSRVHMTMETSTSFKILYVHKENIEKLELWEDNNPNSFCFSKECPYVKEKLINFSFNFF